MRTCLLMILLSIASFARSAPAPIEADGGPGVLFVLGAGVGWGRTADNVLRLYDDYARIPRLDDREAGTSLQLGAGCRLLDDLTVGVELLAWSRRADDDLASARLDLITAAVAVTWHPWRGGLFARLGYGLGSARLDYLERGRQEIMHDTGTCYLLACGYELRLGGALSLSPQISHAAFATRDLEVWASLTSL
ncbi:autotransporter outer membrane beta-barrel domain-containing protein, partial [bacterium]|nr:autotransporter outer membrane beta-barrel domain-containing protein [bacterium]